MTDKLRVQYTKQYQVNFYVLNAFNYVSKTFSSDHILSAVGNRIYGQTSGHYLLSSQQTRRHA